MPPHLIKHVQMDLEVWSALRQSINEMLDILFESLRLFIVKIYERVIIATFDFANNYKLEMVKSSLSLGVFIYF